MSLTETGTIATTRLISRSTSLARCAAAVTAVLAFNLVVYAVGRACGAAFRYTTGSNVARVDAAAVTFMSMLPLATGLAITAWLSRRWPVLATIVKVVAPVLAITTIGAMTIPARFDTTSALCLSTMHLALIPTAIFTVGQVAPRRRLAAPSPA